VDELPDEIEGDEFYPADEPEVEFKVLTIEAEAAASTIEEMLNDSWTLDDHMSLPPQVILIFSREKGD
jgi:hypothetical protein